MTTCTTINKDGEVCGNKARPHGDGEPTCRTHGSQAKGTGAMKCGVCGKGQNKHALGYFEHVELVGMEPAVSAATRVRVEKAWT